MDLMRLLVWSFQDCILYKMCRLLAVKSKKKISIIDHLKKFAFIAENSKEYQGHGWGCAFLKDGEWQLYKNIAPIWEDDLNKFGETTLLVAHARSAFKNEGILIENNMPFFDQEYVFVFNGELHGVKIKERGRIGAEKIFNYIKRFNKGNNSDLFFSLKRAVSIIEKRAGFIKAMNIIIANKKNFYLNSQFKEDPEYFTMFKRERENMLVICSKPYPNEAGWGKIENKTLIRISFQEL